jgi:hypothetical protein
MRLNSRKIGLDGVSTMHRAFRRVVARTAQTASVLRLLIDGSAEGKLQRRHLDNLDDLFLPHFLTPRRFHHCFLSILLLVVACSSVFHENHTMVLDGSVADVHSVVVLCVCAAIIVHISPSSAFTKD